MLILEGRSSVIQKKIISFVDARRLMLSGCCGFIATVRDTHLKELTLDQVLVVCECLDVFWEDLPGLTPTREIEFAID